MSDVKLTAEDLQEMADQMLGNITPVPSEDELREAIRREPDIFHLAQEWSWGDTEARDQLYLALHKLRTEQVKAAHPLPWRASDRVVFDANGKVIFGETCGAPSALVAGWLVDVAENAILNRNWS